MIDPRLLEYLATTAEAGSIGAAARRLHITQPTLSHQIRKLETLTGLTLFDRHHAGVSLTDDGVALLAAAQDVLRAHRHLDRVVADRRREHSQELSLGLVENVPASVLSSLLSGLRDRAPKLRVDTIAQSTPDNLTAVRTATLDAAIVRGPIALDRTIEATPIWLRPVGLLLRTDHPLAELDEIPVHRLRDEALITFPRRWAPEAFDHDAAVLAEHGIDLAAATSSHNVAQTTGFVGAGIGVSLVTDGWFSGAAELTWRPLGEVALTVSLHLVTRSAARLPRPLRSLHDAAAAAADLDG
ncbi:MAG: LysR family transcriptional regulator [Actinomycetota bacterium]